MAAGLSGVLKRAFTGPASKDVLKAALPGAGLNLALGTLMGGPVEGLAYAVGDLALTYPALRAARKFAPGVQQEVKNLATGKVTKSYAPSAVENITNVAASLGSGALVSAALTPKEQMQTAAQQFLAQQAQQVNPALQSQPVQIAQQNVQRSAVNRQPLYQQLLSPNTMYQMQGVEQTADNFQYPGLTIPPELLAQIQAGGMM
jgi:hypothetical protein